MYIYYIIYVKRAIKYFLSFQCNSRLYYVSYSLFTDDANESKRSLFNLRYPKIFQKHPANSAEAALASMETLDDKLDNANDGMETVKLETEVGC